VLDDDDDLESIAFDVHVAADLDDETATDIAERAEGICHVHSALRDDLHADVSVYPGAFWGGDDTSTGFFATASSGQPRDQRDRRRRGVTVARRR